MKCVKIPICVISIFATSPAASQSATTLFTYDELGRVSVVQTGDGEKSTYSFDTAGNRTQVSVKKQFEVSWLGTQLYHGTGQSDPSGGWSANVLSGEGHMIYGPYTTTVPTGMRTAVFRMLVDDSTHPSPDAISYIDVFDATAGETLGIRTLTWTSFKSSWSYQIFEIPFLNDASRVGHMLEFRVWHANRAHINVERVGYY